MACQSVQAPLCSSNITDDLKIQVVYNDKHFSVMLHVQVFSGPIFLLQCPIKSSQ